VDFLFFRASAMPMGRTITFQYFDAVKKEGADRVSSQFIGRAEGPVFSRQLADGLKGVPFKANLARPLWAAVRRLRCSFLYERCSAFTVITLVQQASVTGVRKKPSLTYQSSHESFQQSARRSPASVASTSMRWPQCRRENESLPTSAIAVRGSGRRREQEDRRAGADPEHNSPCCL
jgi:hypothetical protein